MRYVTAAAILMVGCVPRGTGEVARVERPLEPPRVERPLEPPRVERPLEPPRLEVIAHRGASGVAPENTMAAFRRADEVGAHRIELDVQQASDGAVMVFHDDTLGRTSSGTGAIADHTGEELRALDCGSWFGEAFAGEPMPTLAEVLDWSAGRITLNVELKVVGDAEVARRLAAASVALVRERGLTEETVFSSFDAVAAAEAVRLCPECEVAFRWNGERPAEPFAAAEAASARALHLSARGLSAEVVAAARERRWPVRVYTINDQPTLERAVSLGVDGVFTDYPERVLGWLGGVAPEPAR